MAAPLIDREALDDALTDVFLTYGYEGATLTHLAAATGLSKASLYHHYPGGKAAMAASLLRASTQQAEQLAIVPLRGKGGAKQRLHNFLDGFDRYTHSGERMSLVCVFAHSAAEPLQEQSRLALNEWRTSLAAAYDALVVERPKRAARLAEHTLDALIGAMYTAHAFRQPKLLRRAIKRLRRLVADNDAEGAQKRK